MTFHSIEAAYCHTTRRPIFVGIITAEHHCFKVDPYTIIPINLSHRGKEMCGRICINPAAHCHTVIRYSLMDP